MNGRQRIAIHIRCIGMGKQVKTERSLNLRARLHNRLSRRRVIDAGDMDRNHSVCRFISRVGNCVIKRLGENRIAWPPSDDIGIGFINRIGVAAVGADEQCAIDPRQRLTQGSRAPSICLIGRDTQRITVGVTILASLAICIRIGVDNITRRRRSNRHGNHIINGDRGIIYTGNNDIELVHITAASANICGIAIMHINIKCLG